MERPVVMGAPAIPGTRRLRNRVGSHGGTSRLQDRGAYHVQHPEFIPGDAVEDAAAHDRFGNRRCQLEGEPDVPRKRPSESKMSKRRPLSCASGAGDSPVHPEVPLVVDEKGSRGGSGRGELRRVDLSALAGEPLEVGYGLLPVLVRHRDRLVVLRNGSQHLAAGRHFGQPVLSGQECPNGARRREAPAHRSLERDGRAHPWGFKELEFQGNSRVRGSCRSGCRTGRRGPSSLLPADWIRML